MKEKRSRQPEQQERQLEEIFGRDISGNPTRDDHAMPTEEDAREQWYRENRPPHHES